MADPLFGLELMYHVHRGDLREPADAAVLFIHWTLSSSGLQAEHPTVDAAAGLAPARSERLPPGWRDGHGVYEVTYVSRAGSRFLLKVLLVEGQLIANMSKLDSDTTAVFNKPLSEMVSGGLDQLGSLYSNANDLRKQVVTSLVEVMLPRPAATSSSAPGPASRRQQQPPADPLRGGAHGGAYGRPNYGDPLAVGGADLDPLGRGIGGGMLMDPRRPPVSNLPPGVPPGARFDPYGPPGVGPRPGGPPRPRVPGEPNPDHIRMPGYDDYDNMFM